MQSRQLNEFEFESEVAQSQLGPKSDQGDPGRLLFHALIDKFTQYLINSIDFQSS